MEAHVPRPKNIQKKKHLHYNTSDIQNAKHATCALNLKKELKNDKAIIQLIM